LNKEAFWNNRTSFYFLGEQLLEKRKKIISDAVRSGAFPEKYSREMYYSRLIDYLFWQMPPYIGMGIPEEGLAIENINIFKDPHFLAGFKEMERHGFKLLSPDSEDIDGRIKEFTRLSYTAYREMDGKEGFRTVSAFTMIFLKLLSKTCSETDDVNYYSALINELRKNETREAKYVNSLIN